MRSFFTGFDPRHAFFNEAPRALQISRQRKCLGAQSLEIPDPNSVSRLRQPCRTSIELNRGLAIMPSAKPRHAPADLGHDLAKQGNAVLLADALGFFRALQQRFGIAEKIEQLRPKGERERKVKRMASAPCVGFGSLVCDPRLIG